VFLIWSESIVCRPPSYCIMIQKKMRNPFLHVKPNNTLVNSVWCFQMIRQTKSDSRPPNYCILQWYTRNSLMIFYFNSTTLIQQWIIYPLKALEEINLIESFVLPKEPVSYCSISLWYFCTICPSQFSDMEENDGWSFLWVKLDNT